MAKYKLTELDKIWNRACDSFSTEPLETGDRALRDLLRAHNLICNGGVFQAFAVLNEQEIQAAKGGYRFFGLPEVADLLARAKELLDKKVDLEEYEDPFDREYARYVPEESDLQERFKKHHASKPSDFAPLTPDGPK